MATITTKNGVNLRDANVYVVSSDGSYEELGKLTSWQATLVDPRTNVQTIDLECIRGDSMDYDIKLELDTSALGEHVKKLSESLRHGFSNLSFGFHKTKYDSCDLTPVKIIQNGPAFIVFWKDGTKTVLKKKVDDLDDIYAAFGQAMMIKIFGSNSAAHKVVDRSFMKQEAKNGRKDEHA